MHRVRRERGQANRDVFRAASLGTALPNPLSRMGDDALAGVNIEGAAAMLDAQHATEHDGDLLELRLLPRLDPSLRRDHAGDAHGAMVRIYPARIFLARFRLVAGGLDDRRGWGGGRGASGKGR